MLVSYFDEVKPAPPDQPYYWLGGLMIEGTAIPGMEQELGALAIEVFGHDVKPTKDSEFHATDIASGCKAFKRWRNPADRFEILKRLIRIYDKPTDVFRVAVRINIASLYDGADPEEIALVYFLERVNSFARGRGTIAMLIGDFEKDGAVGRFACVTMLRKSAR